MTDSRLKKECLYCKQNLVVQEGSDIVGSNRLTLWGTAIKNKANKQKLKKKQQFEEGGTSLLPPKKQE